MFDMNTLVKSDNLFSRNKQAFMVLAFYVVFTIVFTYPVAFKMGSAIPGGGDAFHWMRILWYTKIALFEPGHSLIHDNLLFYPDGVPAVAFHSAYNQFMYLALSPFFSLPAIYNLLWLSSFVLGAFGAYLLVRYCTRNSYAALISGIIFAFSPYHLVHSVGHFGATTIQWIPFCALYLLKMSQEGGAKNIICAAVFFVMIAMSDLQYMIYTALFVGILLLYDLYCMSADRIRTRVAIQTGVVQAFGWRDVLAKYCLFSFVAFPFLLLLCFNDIAVALSGSDFLKTDPSEVVKYSADFFSFFLPSQRHPFFGKWVQPIYSSFSGNDAEHTLFIGYAVLALSIYASIALRKDSFVKFWVVVAILFSVLSLGPILHVRGETVFTVFKTTIPLPHLVLYHVFPFLDHSRSVGRLFVIASLAFSVLAGYGTARILSHCENKQKIITIALTVTVVFEFLFLVPLKFYMSSAIPPEIYINLSKDKEQYAILELPSVHKNYVAAVETIYYQTIHGKPLISGHHARLPKNAYDFDSSTPFVRDLLLSKKYNEIVEQDIEHIGKSVLNYYNIRYILVHQKYMQKADIDFTNHILNKTLNTRPVYYKDDAIVAYKIPVEPPTAPFISIGKGWHGLELWADGPARWMNDKASLFVFSPDSDNFSLSFEADSFATDRDVSIVVNENTVVTCNIKKGNAVDKVEIPIHLNKGENLIEFVSLQPGVRPSDVGNSRDKRKLSLAFRNIKLIENARNR